MKPAEFLRSTRFHDTEARRLAGRAHVGAGLLFAAALALTVWGYDTWVLARSRTELVWGKVALGVPIMLLLGVLAGLLAGRKQNAALSILSWTVCGLLLGLTAGWMPYGGYTLVTWILEPRLRAFAVYPMGIAEATRMWFIGVVTCGVGAAAGLVIHLLVERAWDFASPQGRMTARSWAVLFLCTPLAILPGIACDDMANRDLRVRQRAVHDLVAAPVRDAETIAQAAIAPYRDQLSDTYTLHLVAYDLEASDATVDVAFDNGFAVRCIALESVVTGCPPISIRFGQWMQALLADALSEGQSAQLAAYADQFSVNPETVAWLAAQRARTSDEYKVTKETQRGSWVIMAVRFDTSDVLNCYFHGAGPVVLDRCRWER